MLVYSFSHSHTNGFHWKLYATWKFTLFSVLWRNQSNFYSPVFCEMLKWLLFVRMEFYFLQNVIDDDVFFFFSLLWDPSYNAQWKYRKISRTCSAVPGRPGCVLPTTEPISFLNFWSSFPALLCVIRFLTRWFVKFVSHLYVGPPIQENNFSTFSWSEYIFQLCPRIETCFWCCFRTL